MFKRHCLSLVDAYSYDDILCVCWSVGKVPSHALIIMVCIDSVYFILTCLSFLLATVTLLIVGFYWNKSQLFQYHWKPTLKEMFFYIAKLLVLSTVMFKNIFGKNWTERLRHTLNFYDFLKFSPPYSFRYPLPILRIRNIEH